MYLGSEFHPQGSGLLTGDVNDTYEVQEDSKAAPSWPRWSTHRIRLVSLLVGISKHDQGEGGSLSGDNN